MSSLIEKKTKKKTDIAGNMITIRQLSNDKKIKNYFLILLNLTDSNLI